MVERDKIPLVPATLTLYVPAEPEHDRVEVPEEPRITLVGLNEHDSPADGETLEARLTVPVNPFSGEIVTTDVPLAPALMFTLFGLVDILKSGTPITTKNRFIE